MHVESHPEILALDALIKQHEIRFKQRIEDVLIPGKEHIAVRMQIGTHIFDLNVEDEYGDWKEENPALCLCLVMRELEAYAAAFDFLNWCHIQGYPAANGRVRRYHMDLGNLYAEIDKLLGGINSQISDWDFGLNAGAAFALRNRRT